MTPNQSKSFSSTDRTETRGMKRATVSDAPAFLNLNDRAMWVLGFNEAVDASEPLLAVAQAYIDMVHGVENRCMAADGPVTPTHAEITDDELRKVYELARAAIKKATA